MKRTGMCRGGRAKIGIAELMRTAFAIMGKGERNDYTTGNLWLRGDGVPDADRAGTDRKQKTLTIRPIFKAEQDKIKLWGNEPC